MPDVETSTRGAQVKCSLSAVKETHRRGAAAAGKPPFFFISDDSGDERHGKENTGERRGSWRAPKESGIQKPLRQGWARGTESTPGGQTAGAKASALGIGEGPSGWSACVRGGVSDDGRRPARPDPRGPLRG